MAVRLQPAEVITQVPVAARHIVLAQRPIALVVRHAVAIPPVRATTNRPPAPSPSQWTTNTAKSTMHQTDTESHSFHLIAICPEELQSAVADELEALGFSDVSPRYMAVYFTAKSLEDFYRAHLCPRIPSRILLVVGKITCYTPEKLTKNTLKIDWSRYFTHKQTIKIDGVPADRGRGAMNSNTISKSIRLGLNDYFSKVKKSPIPKVELKDPDITLHAYVEQNHCTISIDTTGPGMHKRGYRQKGHDAPIRETLAAGILRLAGYHGEGVLYDPMCGSGTILAEAALMATDMPPMFRRDEFKFKHMQFHQPKVWSKVKAAEIARSHSANGSLVASDINQAAVDLTRESVATLDVNVPITFKHVRFQDSVPPAEKGLIIANLPYGERLAATTDLEKLYQEIGTHLKHTYMGWRAALLCADESPHTKIGLRPTRKYKINNGGIEARLMVFDLYAGTKKLHKIAAKDD